MQTTEKKAWSTAVERIGQEYSLTQLSLEKGSIPPDLNGSIYFNGPAQLERNGQKVGHWFDGDGAVLGIHFHQGTAKGVYRYVQTHKRNSYRENHDSC